MSTLRSGEQAMHYDACLDDARRDRPSPIPTSQLEFCILTSEPNICATSRVIFDKASATATSPMIELPTLAPSPAPAQPRPAKPQA